MSRRGLAVAIVATIVIGCTVGVLIAFHFDKAQKVEANAYPTFAHLCARSDTARIIKIATGENGVVTGSEVEAVTTYASSGMSPLRLTLDVDRAKFDALNVRSKHVVMIAFDCASGGPKVSYALMRFRDSRNGFTLEQFSGEDIRRLRRSYFRDATPDAPLSTAD